MDLAIDTVGLIIPMHDAALGFLRHPVFHQRRRDLILIAAQLTALQQCAAVIEITVLVSLVEIGGQGHIQLEGGQLGRQHGEAVLAGDERQRAAIVPLHKNLPLIIHEVYFALGAGKNGMMGIVHRVQPDAGAGGILFPDKIHHFSVHHRFLHVLLSVVKLQLVDHAAILLSGILHPDRRTIKDVIAGFSKIGVEALAVVAGGEGMLRLILDLGIEAHRLHRGHHTSQPHHIRMIGVADGLELHTGPYEPLQLGKAFESDRLSLLS